MSQAAQSSDIPASIKEPLKQFIEVIAKRYRNAKLQTMNNGLPFSEFRMDWSNELDSLSTVARQAQDSDVQHAACFAWLELMALRPTAPDTTFLEKALQAVPPTSSLWEFPLGTTPSPMGLIFSCHCSGRMRTYFETIANSHPSDNVRAQALYDLTEEAYWAQDMEAMIRYRIILVERFPTSELARMVAREFPTNPQVVVGNRAPNFLVRDLYKTDQVYSNTSFRDKYYLIDFWFTTCKPCVAEMPFLHEAYKRFKDKGLEIMSINIEGASNEVQRFREKWPMPWLHVENIAGPSLASVFEVVYYPRTLLINPDGVIVAIDETLRGKKLIATLEQCLGVSSSTITEKEQK